MRFPRVRFTVGSLVLLVAVVAVNCWAIQRLNGGDELGTGPVPWDSPDPFVGVLPLINVAAIGAVRFAAASIRLICYGRGPARRVSGFAFTYFSVSLVALGCVFYSFVPNAVPARDQASAAAMDYAKVSWEAVLGPVGEGIPWFVFACTVLGLIWSGPPLLVAGLGQALATRYAAEVSARRYRAMTCLVSLAIAVVALAICVTPRPFEDECEVALDFQVVEKGSGRPIRSAFVCITDPFAQNRESVSPRVLTEADGRARLTGRFPATGEQNAFQTFGAFSPWGRWLLVSAPGYQTVHLALPEVIGPLGDLIEPSRGKVSLAKGKTPESGFREIAGKYLGPSSGFSGSYFQFTADGRFDRTWWSCTRDTHEYGYVQWKRDAFELVPVPHPDRPVTFAHWEYRIVPWGDRVYLASMREQDLHNFCRWALTPNRPSNRFGHGLANSYLRYGDEDKPQTGLPQLPLRVWVTFLIGEANLSNPKGSLRLALESIVPTRFRKAKAERAQRREGLRDILTLSGKAD